MQIEPSWGADMAPSAAPVARNVPVEFTGSGSEYFRIWIVNLLLIIVTLTLYTPFARARRLTYFQGNTRIDGHALGFHGNPRKMFRGYLLMVLLGVAYGASGQFSPAAGVFAFCVLAVVWPALWRASLQFRLANTSWRGVRMRFSGDLKGSYMAMLPSFAPAIVLVAASRLMQPASADAAAPADEPQMALVWLMLAGMLAMMALFPLSWAWIKRYQHGHYHYAGEQTTLSVGPRRFYALALYVSGVSLLAGLIFAVAMGVGVALMAINSVAARVAAAALVIAPAYLAFLSTLSSYTGARLQNLVWNSTSSRHVEFHSTLLFNALLRLTLKNVLLTVLTLGLYRPFAVIAATRLKLQAMTLTLEGDVDHWVADGASRMDDASGDAAGDFFGIDMGL